MTNAELTRFNSRIRREGDCWLWTGARTANGYAELWADGTVKLGHRLAYEHFVGPIPAGLTIDHVKARGCESRHCVNPDHLEIVTQRENVLRGSGFAAVNAQKTHCPRNHPYSGDNLIVKRNGARACRECKRARDRVA